MAQVAVAAANRDGSTIIAGRGIGLEGVGSEYPGGKTLAERLTLARLNGERSVTLWVTKEQSGSVVNVANEVRRVVDAYGESLNEDISFEIRNDTSVEVRDILLILQRNAIFGIALEDGLVLMSSFHQKSKSGKNLSDAIDLGVKEKLRPVLMTTFTTIFGVLPLLLARGPGAEIQRPLATVVVGGLLTSTLVTLIVLPLVYESLKKRFTK
mgnify:CR=1 FL=1